jgi:hypothetical protein
MKTVILLTNIPCDSKNQVYVNPSAHLVRGCHMPLRVGLTMLSKQPVSLLRGQATRPVAICLCTKTSVSILAHPTRVSRIREIARRP